MMDKAVYEAARKASGGIFNNALVLPVAAVILREVEEDGSFTIPELRTALVGWVADNQIRDALKRIVAAEAVARLDSLGGSRADVWVRRSHPFWDFVAERLKALSASTERP